MEVDRMWWMMRCRQDVVDNAMLTVVWEWLTSVELG